MTDVEIRRVRLLNPHRVIRKFLGPAIAGHKQQPHGKMILFFIGDIALEGSNSFQHGRHPDGDGLMSN